MNILVIHEVDWLKKVVYEVHDIPELLSLRGHDVTVIDYEENWQRNHAFDLARFSTDIVSGASRAFTGSSVELRRPGLVKAPGLDRLSSLALQFAEIRRTLERKHFDIVFLYAMPTSGLSAVWLARRAGVPVLFRAIDVLHKLRKGPMARAILWAERFGYPAVDGVVALTPQMKRYVCELGAREDRVEVLLPGIDTHRFKPAAKDPALLARHGLKQDDRVLLFMGTLYGFAGLDFMIERMPEIIAAVPRARLVLVGGAGEEAALRAQAEQSGLRDKIVFTGFIGYQQLADYINLADVTLNPFRDEAITRSVFPGKILQYLACGKPLLTTPLPGIAQVLSGEQQGVVFRQLDDAFVAGAIELLRDEPRATQLGAAALRHVQAAHAWDTVITRLVGIFERTIAGHHTSGANRIDVCAS